MGLFNFLSKTTLISKEELINFSKSAPYRYKVYDIPKRNGNGVREIAHPSKELKLIQRLCTNFLSEILPVHRVATAYRKGLSIKDNARAHVNNKFLLKMDFSDFFPSITPQLFFYICRYFKIEMTLEERAFLRHILFRKDRKEKKFKLSIGAPSSPLISNFVMAIFDEEVSIYCGSLGVAFTRYADDLAFSTNKKGILFDIPNQVKTILGETTQNKITVNDSKTVFSSTKHNRHITGVTISNDRKLSIGRQKKRMISAMVHKFSFGVLEEDKIANLQGQLAFVKNIEPEFLDRLTTKYGIDVILKIFPSSGKNT